MCTIHRAKLRQALNRDNKLTKDELTVKIKCITFTEIETRAMLER